MKKWIIGVLCLIILMIVLGIIYTYKEEKIEYIGYKEFSYIYDKNDLKTEEINMNNDSEYIKISGLKNKKIEKKINKKLYDLSKKYVKEGKKIKPIVRFNSYNILSIEYGGQYINIDLTTGNEIKLKDLIDSDNITPVIAHGYYESISKQIAKEIKEKKELIRLITSEGRTPDARFEKEIEELNEELSNIYEKAVIFSKNIDDDINYSISPTGITIPDLKIDVFRNRAQINLDVNDSRSKLNFYYKYMTKESIYDGTYKGKKGIDERQYRRQ